MDGWIIVSADGDGVGEGGHIRSKQSFLFNIPRDKKVHDTGTKFSRNINDHDRSVQMLWSHSA